MANRTLFKTKNSKSISATAVNLAEGQAYSYDDEHKLCQYVATGCLSNTFYASATDQLSALKEAISKCSSELIAKAAVYGAEEGMKEVPSYLIAALVARGETELVKKIFPRVCTSVKMLCNVVQIIRSGDTGRRSFGTVTKNLIREWFASRSPQQIYNASIGQANPSIADIVKMVHPKPESKDKESLYGYLLGKPYDINVLPNEVRKFIFRNRGESQDLPNLPFRALTNLNLTDSEWITIGQNMPWNTLRMNLNLLNKHGVFSNAVIAKQFAEKLADKESVKRSKVFPYQLLTTYQNTTDIPTVIRNALQDALEVATENVPKIGDKVVVCPDLSGSMYSPATGSRNGVASVTTCVDVAALVSACLARVNPEAEVLAWASTCKKVKFNPRDTVITLSNQFKHCGVGGGTNAQLPLSKLNEEGWRGDAIVYISDNQSWMGSYAGITGTGMENEWLKLKKRSPKTKLISIDIQSYGSTQLSDRKDVLNIGGWGDNCWNIMAKFVNREEISFVDEIKAIEL